MIQGSVTIVEYANTVPQLGVILQRRFVRDEAARADAINSHLGGREQVQGLLISGVRPLQFVTHEVTMSYAKQVIRA